MYSIHYYYYKLKIEILLMKPQDDSQKNLKKLF